MLSPGPGAYDAHATQMMKKAPGWRIGSATRDDRERAILRNKIPPPGTHNPNFDSVGTKQASWSFGTSTRPALNQTKNTPGAGTYDIPGKAIEGPAFVIGLKLDNQSSIGLTVGRT